jgi:hypothetical protein
VSRDSIDRICKEFVHVARRYLAEKRRDRSVVGTTQKSVAKNNTKSGVCGCLRLTANVVAMTKHSAGDTKADVGADVEADVKVDDEAGADVEADVEVDDEADDRLTRHTARRR